MRFAPKVVSEPVVAARRRAVQNPTTLHVADFRQSPPDRAGVALRDAWDQWGVVGMRSVCRHALARGDIATRHGLDRTFVLEVPDGTDTGAMAAALSELTDQVELAEVDGIGHIAQLIPNDAMFNWLWGLHNTGSYLNGLPDADIDAPEAWALHAGGLGTVTVAIVDTGVNEHAEFTGRMVAGTNTTSRPWDGTVDGYGHGTHVAGIVAASGNNGIGVAGVTWGAYIMPVRVFIGDTGNESDTAEGVIWAVDNGADVINISLQWCYDEPPLFIPPSEFFQAAIDYAYDNGVLVVAAGGNNGWCSGKVTWPAHFANCMAVSGTNNQDVLALYTNTSHHWSSNYGPEIDVCAPGDYIWSTSWLSTTSYRAMSGTSMSTPVVTGLAALAKSFVPSLTHDDLRTLLTETADDLGPVGRDDEYGHGRINAHQALLNAGPVRVIVSSPPDGAIDARQPSEPDGSDPAGWQSVDLMFGGPLTDIADVLNAEYSVTQEGGEGPPPAVASVTQVEGEDRWVRITLDRTVSPGAWTTVTHVASGTSISLGYLPADVNADRTSAPADILRIIDVMNGVVDLPIWSTDVDRSGVAGPPDILRVVDLLNGAGTYDVYLNATLP